jgi:hypothetical protein
LRKPAWVVAGIDQIPFEVLAQKLASISGRHRRCECAENRSLQACALEPAPGWWNDIPKGDVRRITPTVEEKLQRPVGMGHADTRSLIRQLAVTGDRHAIPILKQALRHHRSDVRTDAALALHALGDAGGLETPTSGLHSAGESDRWKFASALECIRNPRATAACCRIQCVQASH